MASALMILFLGCWLAGQSGVSGEGSDSAENQQPDSTTMEPEEEWGINPTQPRATPTPAHPGGTGPDAGSSPTQRTNPTQPRATLTPAHPGGTGPGGTGLTRSGTTPTSTCPCGVRSGNESGGSESPSTPPKPAGSQPASPRPQHLTQPSPGREKGRGPHGAGGEKNGHNWGQNLPPGERVTPTGGSEPSPAPGPTRNIIAGVSAVAAGLFLLLLVIFLCYRRKGPAPRQSRESEPATTVYALMGEGKQLDVLPQKPDPGAEGLTYAELDGQALQAKQGGAAPAPEPVLYATITMSQGPNGQSPQGAAEPPTDPDSVNPGEVTGETGQEASATTE